jgi:hypothetical protein
LFTHYFFTHYFFTRWAIFAITSGIRDTHAKLTVMEPLFHALVLSAHLITVSLAAGVPMVVCWTIWRPFGSREFDVSATLMKLTNWMLMVGALFGIGYGTLVWSERFSKALQYTGSRLTFAIFELLFSLAVFLVVWWRINRKRYTPGTVERSVISVALFAASTNLVYHFPIFFAVVKHIQANITTIYEPLSSDQFRSIAFGSSSLIIATHFILALFILSLHTVVYLLTRSDSKQPISKPFTRGLLCVSLVLFVLQIGSGLATFGIIPRLEQMAITTGNTEATTVFLVSMLAVLLMPVFQIVQIRDPGNPRNARWLMIWTGIIYWLMTSAMTLARIADV